MKSFLLTSAIFLSLPTTVCASNISPFDDRHQSTSSFGSSVIKPEPHDDDYSRPTQAISEISFSNITQPTDHKRTADKMSAVDPSFTAQTVAFGFKEPLPKRPKVQQDPSPFAQPIKQEPAVNQTPQHTAFRSTPFNFANPASLTKEALNQLNRQYNLNSQTESQSEDWTTVKSEEKIDDTRSSALLQDNDLDVTQSYHTTAQPKLEEDEGIKFDIRNSVIVKYNGQDLVINRYHPFGQPYLWDGEEQGYGKSERITIGLEVRFIIADKHSHFKEINEIERKQIRTEIYSREQFKHMNYDSFIQNYFSVMRYYGTQEERNYFNRFFTMSHTKKVPEEYLWIGKANKQSKSICKEGLKIREIVAEMPGGQDVLNKQLHHKNCEFQEWKSKIKVRPEYQEIDDKIFGVWFSTAFKVKHKDE